MQAKGHIEDDKLAEFTVPIVSFIVVIDETVYDDKGEPIGRKWASDTQVAMRYSYRKAVWVRNGYIRSDDSTKRAYIDEIKGFEEEFIGADVDTIYTTIKAAVDYTRKSRYNRVWFNRWKNEEYFKILIKAIPRAIRITHFWIDDNPGSRHKELTEIWQNTPVEEREALDKEIYEQWLKEGEKEKEQEERDYQDDLEYERRTGLRACSRFDHYTEN